MGDAGGEARAPVDERVELNRALWDERVPIHVASAFYDVAGFKAGRSTLEAFEAAELGPLDGRRVCHLQCHFGMDSMSLVRLGADVVGVDFSRPAIETATALADELGLSDRARFVEASVYDARAVVEGDVDLVYVTWGALIWLPDIEAWARVVASLLKPGGFLYLAEAHPFAGALHPAEGAPGLLVEQEPYGRSTQLDWDEPGTYAEPDAPTVNTRSVEFRHGLDQIVSALAAAGLHLDWLHERPELVWPMWPTMEQGDDGLWRQPGSNLPLSFSLKATRPDG